MPSAAGRRNLSRPGPRLGRIVSGGQSGVDRAALEAARAHGVPAGGWCPAGGWAEDRPEPPGVLAEHPELTPTASGDPAERTRRNVRDSDATLIVTRRGCASPGTELTRSIAGRLGRPCAEVATDDPDAARAVAAAVAGLPDGYRLNVAGPRESECPGVGAAARLLLDALLPGLR